MINTVVNTGIWKITATRNILQNFKLQIRDFIENLSKLKRGAKPPFIIPQSCNLTWHDLIKILMKVFSEP